MALGSMLLDVAVDVERGESLERVQLDKQIDDFESK